MSDSKLAFYEFPNNISGSALIPIISTPTPLAAVTVRVNENEVVSVRATAGWTAGMSQSNYVPVLFKIWRGAPNTGTLIVSVLDSGERNYDLNKVTTISGIDSGITQPQDVTYVLTAEIPADSNLGASVVGGLTMTATPNKQNVPNQDFFFTTLPQNTVGGALIPVANSVTPLFDLVVPISETDTIALRATIGWTVLSRLSKVLFKLWRGAPYTGKLVGSVIDSGESVADKDKVTSFSLVDSGFDSSENVVYVLTAETIDVGTSAQVVGAMTLTATRYQKFSQQQETDSDEQLATVSYYTLPDNTAGSVSIPISKTPQPLGLVTIRPAADGKIFLAGSIGWETPQTVFPKTDVLFKLWRGAPIIGTLIYSVDDSSDFDRNKVTSLMHVDSGLSPSQDVTYFLTAELPDNGTAANVIGALTITASAGL